MKSLWSSFAMFYRSAGRRGGFALLVAITMLVSGPAGQVGVAVAAAPPNTVSLQGYLTTNAGTGLDGVVALTVRFYAASTGGSALHAEVLSSVAVANGRFKILLGKGTALPSTLFSDNSSLYVGLSVDGGAELPRRELASAPYALNSARAETASSADVATLASDLTCVGCVGTADIADANVTAVKLANDVTAAFVDAAGDTMTGELVASAGVNLDSTQVRYMRFHNAASAPVTCAADKVAFVYFNTTDDRLYVCSGSSWIPLTSGGTAADEDGDGVPNTGDNCFSVANADQNDTDSDGAGDACDTDDDGDGVLDGSDNCPRSSNASQTDTDGDGAGDACDTDDDNDGVLDVSDNCVLVANADQVDLDGDGQGNACDLDDDGDGSNDTADCQPLNAGVYPGATETCNSVDDDCDSSTDEGEDLSGCTVYYRDGDGDAYGLTSDSKCLCGADTANDYDATAGADCNDAAAAVNPGATETCNSTDDDCDGSVDEDNVCGCATPPDQVADTFDGSSLHWAWRLNKQGAAPTYAVSGGKISITDSTPPETPSRNDGQLWIYDPSQDLGNQLARAFPAGTRDFDVTVQIAAQSSTAEITKGGFALTAPDSNQLLAFVGIHDSQSVGHGAINAEAFDDDDVLQTAQVSAPAASASATVRFQRCSGLLTISSGGSNLLTVSFNRDIGNLVIYHAKHQSGATPYAFGTVEVSDIDARYSGPTCVADGWPTALDEFDGNNVGAHWNVTGVGDAPTYSVSGGEISITDSTVAASTSAGWWHPPGSCARWIYHGTDKGNQMQWNQPLGTGDFEVEMDLEVNSTDAETTYLGVGLTTSDGTIRAMAGGLDGLTNNGGHNRLMVHGERVQIGWGDPAYSNTLSGNYRMVRCSGLLHVYRDGVPIAVFTDASDLQRVALVHTRNRSPGPGCTVQPIGDMNVSRIRVRAAGAVPPVTQAQFTVQNVATNDGWASTSGSSYYRPVDEDLIAGADYGGTGTWMIFDGTSALAGQTIQSASLRIFEGDRSSGNNATVEILGVKLASPTYPTSASAFQQLIANNGTTARVQWSGDLPEGANQTPDISAVLQEVIDTVTPSKIMIIIRGISGGHHRYATVETDQGSASLPARLDVEY